MFFRRLRAPQALEPRHLLSAAPALLLDINPWPNALMNGPIGFLESADHVAVVQENASADELGARIVHVHKTDGTIEGTSLEATIDGSILRRFEIGDRFLLHIAKPNRVQELWTTDGTRRGTERIASVDLRNGNMGVVAYPDVVVFLIHEHNEPLEFWRTDGTSAGTRIFDNVTAHSARLFYPPIRARIGDQLFFDYDFEDTGRELWVTNVDSGNARMVADLNPGPAPSHPVNLLELESQLVFSALTETGWKDLVTDGTPEGTREIIGPGGEPLAETTRLHEVSDDLLLGSTPISEAEHQFFVMNSSFESTDIGVFPGPPEHVQALGSGFTFVIEGDLEDMWWQTDGTPAGTKRIEPNQHRIVDQIEFQGKTLDINGAGEMHVNESGIRTVIDTDSNALRFFNVANGKVYFSVVGNELWETDGTAEGTRFTTSLGDDEDFTNFNGDYIEDAVLDGLVRGSTVIFNTGSARSVRRGIPAQMWSVDIGAESPTPLIEGTQGTSSSSPYFVASLGSRLLYSAWSSQPGRQLWSTDGTSSGTERIGIPPTIHQIVGDTMYALSFERRLDEAILWKTNGTTESTVTISSSIPATPNAMYLAGDQIYFTANDNLELWTSDGTETGTELVRTFSNGIKDAIEFNDRLFLIGNSCTTTECPPQIWQSNGTVDGTFGIELPFSTQHLVSHARVVEDKLFFTVNTPESPLMDVWFLDTANITHQVASGDSLGLGEDVEDFEMDGEYMLISSGRQVTTDGTGFEASDLPSSGRIRQALQSDGIIYFHFVQNERRVAEVWRTDGTADGTRQLYRGVDGERITLFDIQDDQLYFLSRWPTGRTLWRTDGEVDGTVEFFRFTNDEFLRSIVSDGDSIYLSVDHDVSYYWSSTSVWKSDGIPGNTIRLAEVVTGLESDQRVQLANSDTLLLTAVNVAHGEELYRLGTDTPPLPGDTDGDFDVDNTDFMVVAQNFGKEVDAAFAEGDFDEDGAVSFADFLLLAANYGQRLRRT